MKTLAPGSTIGIIGGGQLARMMILEGRKMGYRFIVMDPASDCACASIANEMIVDRWSSLNGALKLASQCDVVTLDTEHVPWQSLEAMEEKVPVYPSSKTLKQIQDRLSQKTFLEDLGLGQAPFANIESISDFDQAVQVAGLPCVLKTRTFGYDGKGQAMIKTKQDLEVAWEKLGSVPCIVESYVDFHDEVSVLLARTKNDSDAHIEYYPIAKNIHHNHILHKTVVPSGYGMNIEKKCKTIAKEIVEAFDYIGLMAIEMFVTQEEDVLVNEIAPRTHNSGHFTFDACQTSQFEQHIRAITGQGLGSPEFNGPVIMVNLLGDLWQQKAPNLTPILQDGNATLHWYDKHPAKMGRKMGHFTIMGQDIEKMDEKARQYYQSLLA